MRFWYVLLFSMLIGGCGADSAQSVERGREVYMSYGCAVCHGREGLGDGLTADQFSPRPINLHDANAYRQGTSRREMLRTLEYGLWNKDSAMPAYGHLSRQELRDLVAYFTVTAPGREATLRKTYVWNRIPGNYFYFSNYICVVWCQGFT